MNLLPMEFVSFIIGFAPGWQVEVTFEKASVHLGVETQRQWSNLARKANYSCQALAVLTSDAHGSFPTSRFTLSDYAFLA